MRVWAVACKSIDCPGRFRLWDSPDKVFRPKGRSIKQRCVFCGEKNTFLKADAFEEFIQPDRPSRLPAKTVVPIHSRSNESSAALRSDLQVLVQSRRMGGPVVAGFPAKVDEAFSKCWHPLAEKSTVPIRDVRATARTSLLCSPDADSALVACLKGLLFCTYSDWIGSVDNGPVRQKGAIDGAVLAQRAFLLRFFGGRPRRSF